MSARHVFRSDFALISVLFGPTLDVTEFGSSQKMIEPALNAQCSMPTGVGFL